MKIFFNLTGGYAFPSASTGTCLLLQMCDYYLFSSTECVIIIFRCSIMTLEKKTKIMENFKTNFKRLVTLILNKKEKNAPMFQAVMGL